MAAGIAALVYLKETLLTVVVTVVLVSLTGKAAALYKSCKDFLASLVMAVVEGCQAVSTGLLKTSYLVSIQPVLDKFSNGELAGPVATTLSNLS